MSSTDPALDLSELSDQPVLVCTHPGKLTHAQRASILLALEQQLPDRKIIVLDSGMRIEGLVSGESLERIEAKVDELLDLLQPDEVLDTTTVHGSSSFAAERDQTRPL